MPLSGEYYCFPDFVLTHSGGSQVALELFHPWHASHLTARLDTLAESKSPALLIGVSRVLLKDPLVAEATEQSDYFQNFGFEFNQMPTVTKLGPVLERWLADRG